MFGIRKQTTLPSPSNTAVTSSATAPVDPQGVSVPPRLSPSEPQQTKEDKEGARLALGLTLAINAVLSSWGSQMVETPWSGPLVAVHNTGRQFVLFCHTPAREHWQDTTHRVTKVFYNDASEVVGLFTVVETSDWRHTAKALQVGFRSPWCTYDLSTEGWKVLDVIPQPDDPDELQHWTDALHAFLLLEPQEAP